MSFLRRFGARRDGALPAAERFTNDLFSSRLAKPAVAVGMVLLGVGVAWLSNAVSTPAGIAAGLAVVGAVVGATLILDRGRWRGQEVVLWQQAGRERRWREETGGPSPVQHPAQAETWLGTHPRGTVPQVYRVTASTLAGDPVAREREVAAWVPASDTEAAWKSWAVAAPLALVAEPVDLAPVRAALDVLPDSDERRQLAAGLAVAEALRRHHAGDRGWLEPLFAARAWVRREPLPVRQHVRIGLMRFGILLSFLVPAVGLAGSGIGAPEPFPRAWLETTFATRGDVGEIDHERLQLAMPVLAAQVGASEPLYASPLAAGEIDYLIGGGLPTLIWDVEAADLAPPRGVACDHVWSVESLLGEAQPGGPVAIVTCEREQGPAYRVPLDPATAAELRAALGLPLAP